MFLRISGSSSTINIFFMVPSKNGKAHRHRCAFANPAVQLQLSTVQVNTAPHQKEAESGAGPRSHVAAAVKDLEQVLLIFLRNADPMITNGTHCVTPIPFNRELHRRSRLRILHSVAQEICKNVPEQSLVRLGLRRNGGQQQFNVASAICRRENLIEHAAAKCVQVECGRLKVQFAGIQAAEDKDRFHHDRHPAGIPGDRFQLLFALAGRHLFYGSTTALTPLNGNSSTASRAGEVSGIVARNFPKSAERYLYEPG